MWDSRGSSDFSDSHLGMRMLGKSITVVSRSQPDLKQREAAVAPSLALCPITLRSPLDSQLP